MASILMFSCSKQTEVTEIQHTNDVDFLEAPDQARPVKPEGVPCLYVDFDGENIQHPQWNGGNLIQCAPALISEADKTIIMARVQEAYGKYKLTITTSATVFNNAKNRQRVVVTPTSSWYAGSVSGIAYIGSFFSSTTAPAFVFSDRLSNNPKYIGDIIMHEAGHTLGLYHQSEYNSSCGLVSAYRYSTIMGYPFNVENPAWANGTSTSCTNYQNDTLHLQQRLGLR